MAGFLAAAVSGGAKEYLKQSDESREELRQKIRDERLQEFQVSNINLQAQLTTDENIRKEGVLAKATEAQRKHEAEQKKLDRDAIAAREKADREFKAANYEAGLDENVYREGKLVQTGTRQATSASNQAAKALYRMGPNGEKGAATDMLEMIEQYNNDPAVWTEETRDDGFGGTVKVKILKENAEGLIDYVNRNLHKDSRLTTNLNQQVNKSPELMWEFAKSQPQFHVGDGARQALKSINKLFPDWNPPGKQFFGSDAPDPEDPGVSVGIIE